jgi:hypothetical protein
LSSGVLSADLEQTDRFQNKMSKAQETKAHIIEQAAALFNQQGYAGCSISDLMQVTHPRMSYSNLSQRRITFVSTFPFSPSLIIRLFLWGTIRFTWGKGAIVSH